MKESNMTSEEFEITIDELIKGMTTLHNRLLRIEKWMSTQEEARKKAKLFQKISGKRS
jgi:hypothetical protein